MTTNSRLVCLSWWLAGSKLGPIVVGQHEQRQLTGTTSLRVFQRQDGSSLSPPLLDDVGVCGSC